jgi:flagellar basal-body rod modification protein FlgD
MELSQIAGATSGQVAKKDGTAANADRFLTMLVAQMKNQDPLNPLDNAQVTSQMAQLSTVEGINKLNTSLQALSAGFNSAQALQATSLVGRQVMTEGNTLALSQGIARGGFQLETPAETLTLTIKSASGAVVHTVELGAQDAGLHLFEWDGKTDSGADAAPGRYAFQIAASDTKSTLKSTSLMLGRVDGVTPAADGAKLDLGALGDAAFASIKHIF